MKFIKYKSKNFYFIVFLTMFICLNNLSVLAVSTEKFNLTQNKNLKLKDDKKTFQCSLCLKMFNFKFDYEKFKDNKQRIQKDLYKILKLNLSNEEIINDYLKFENLDFIAQESSMQYFFKGAENQFNADVNEKIKNCENKETNLDLKDTNCDKFKLNLCESILTFSANTCSGINLSTDDNIINNGNVIINNVDNNIKENGNRIYEINNKVFELDKIKNREIENVNKNNFILE